MKADYDELCAKSDAFLSRHGYVREGGKYRLVKKSKDVIAVFCHGGFGLTWLAHLLDIPLVVVWASFWLAPSSVTTILFEEKSADYAVPRALAVSDCSHLLAAGLRTVNSKYERPNIDTSEPRPSGLKANVW